MSKLLQIVYVGPLNVGGTCLQRQRALEDLGHDVLAVDTCPPQVEAAQMQFGYRVRRKIFGPKDLAHANDKILQIVQSVPVDILWLDKALTIERATLDQVKATRPTCRIVGYSPDDMAGKHNQSHQFLKHLPLYDIYFTTKSFGVQELKSMGCKRVEFIGNAYDPATHHPMAVSSEDRNRLGGPVGFVGNWEPVRALWLYNLAKRGVPVRVWGNRWNRARYRHSNLRLENRPVWGRDYALALCAFDINLGFLSKLNRDLSTQRSVEVPACGAFFLAERTSEHQELFQEDEQAVFFNGETELLQKLHFYRNRPQERARIAQAGRERCLESGYSNQERLRQMLEIVKDLRTGKQDSYSPETLLSMAC